MWGAIAVNDDGGYGFSVGCMTQGEAEWRASQEAGPGSVLVASVFEGFAVLAAGRVDGRPLYQGGTGPSLSDAEFDAMEGLRCSGAMDIQLLQNIFSGIA